MGARQRHSRSESSEGVLGGRWLKRIDCGIAWLVAAAALAAMARAVLAGFINYDDPDYVTANPVVQSLTLDNLKAIWLSFDTPQYYPLVFTSYLLEHSVFGLNPHAFHGTNVFLHALNSALACFLALKLTRSRLAAFIVGVLFAVHPVHVESVAWVTERKDVLSGAFFFGAFLLYLRYRDGRSHLAYALSLALFLLGLFSKTMVATLPLWLLLVDWTEGRRPASKCIWDKLPYLALSGAMLVVTWLSEHGGWMAEGSRLEGLYSPWSALAAPAFYLQKTLLPVGLSMSYPPLHTSAVILGIRVGVSLALVLAALWLLSRRHPAGLFLGFFFVGILPVSGLLPFRYVMVGSPVADRFLYLPVLGFLGAGAVLAAGWAGGHYAKQRGVAIATAVLAVVFGFASWQRCGVFRDTGSLFADALRKDSTSAASSISHLNLGIFLTAEEKYDEAEEHLQEVVRRVPESGRPRHVLGMLRLRQGRTAEAISLFREALDRAPEQKLYRLSLAEALLRTGDTATARSEYERVLQGDPSSPGALDGLGALALMAGSPQEALSFFRRAQAASGATAERHYRMAMAYRMLGRPADAVRALQSAAAIAPRNPDIHLRLGEMLRATGDARGAIEQYRRGLKAAPDNVDLLNSLAWTVATSADRLPATPAEGVAAAERARRVSGGKLPHVLDTLAASYARAGMFEAAVRTQQECVAKLTASGRSGDEERRRLRLYHQGKPFSAR